MNTLIDPESEEFIDWTIKKLDSGRFYHQLIMTIRHKFTTYYQCSDKNIILADLEKKLIAGAKQYGPPSQNVNKNIDEEIKAELIDLIGWYMLGRWFERK